MFNLYITLVLISDEDTDSIKEQFEQFLESYEPVMPAGVQVRAFTSPWRIESDDDSFGNFNSRNQLTADRRAFRMTGRK